MPANEIAEGDAEIPSSLKCLNCFAPCRPEQLQPANCAKATIHSFRKLCGSAIREIEAWSSFHFSKFVSFGDHVGTTNSISVQQCVAHGWNDWEWRGERQMFMSITAMATAMACSGLSHLRNGSCVVPFPLAKHSKACRVASRHPRNYRFGTYKAAADHTTQVATTSIQDVKSALLVALEGLNRGIFGVSAKQKAKIDDLLNSLEALNPYPRPTENLDKVKGEWRLLYSTITILGVKRTKLGLRDFVALGDFLQTIDTEQKTAVNEIGFSVAGLGMLKGSLTIKASYSVTSPTRVDIKFETSSIAPEQLLSLFKKNYDLLLGVFNPEGWLEITYVDDTLRVGRDDKGNVFLVERT